MLQTIAGAIGLVLGYFISANYFDKKFKATEQEEQPVKKEPEPVKEPVKDPVKDSLKKPILQAAFYPDELEVVKRFVEDSFLTRKKLMGLMRDPSVVWVFKDEEPLERVKRIFIRGNGMEIELEYNNCNGTWTARKADIVQCGDCKWRGTNACFCKSPMDTRDRWFCSCGEKVRA